MGVKYMFTITICKCLVRNDFRICAMQILRWYSIIKTRQDAGIVQSGKVSANLTRQLR